MLDTVNSNDLNTRKRNSKFQTASKSFAKCFGMKNQKKKEGKQENIAFREKVIAYDN